MASRLQRKHKSTPSSSHSPERANHDPSTAEVVFTDFHRIKGIIGEDRTRYRIDWEDNTATGEATPPTWEPKANANEEAIADWEGTKVLDTIQVQIQKLEGFDPEQYSQHFCTASGSNPLTSQDHLPTSSTDRHSQSSRSSASILDCSERESVVADPRQLAGSSSFNPSTSSQSSKHFQVTPTGTRNNAAVKLDSTETIPNSLATVGDYSGDQDSVNSPPRTDSSASSPQSAVSIGVEIVDRNSQSKRSPGIASKYTGRQFAKRQGRSWNDEEKSSNVSVEIIAQTPLRIPSYILPLSEASSGLQLAQGTFRKDPTLSQTLWSESGTSQRRRGCPSARRVDESKTAVQTQVASTISISASEDQVPQRDHSQERRAHSEKPSLQQSLDSVNSNCQAINQASKTPSEIWQSGQVLPQSDFSDSQLLTSQDQDLESQQSVNSTVLSQRDPNSIKKPLRSQEISDRQNSTQTSAKFESRDSDYKLDESVQYIASLDTYNASGLTRTSFSPDVHLTESLDSASPQLEITSAASMSESQNASARPSGASLKEKLRHLRANSTAARNADAARSPRSTKSPSAIPSGPPEPYQARTDVQMSLRPQDPHPTIEVQEPNNVEAGSRPASKEVSQQISSLASSAASPRQGEMEFLVPLPMNARVRDQYQQTIFNYRADIEEFTHSAGTADPKLRTRMVEMVDHVKKITLHPDLDNRDTLTQQSVPEHEEAKWAEHSSAKFLFLRHLLDELRSEEKHIAILAQPGQLLDILEVFLRANRVLYNRPDKHSRSDETAVGPMNVTLLPTGEAGAGIIVSEASAVIAFDTSFSAKDRQAHISRTHMFNVGQLAPVISLIVTNSPEHIELCLPTAWDETRRMQALVSCVAQTRHEVGQLSPDMPYADAAAGLVAIFLTGIAKENVPWTLPALGGITTLEAITETPFSTQTATRDEATTATDLASTSNKRAMPVDDDGERFLGKKARMTPLPDATIDSSEVEVPQISESVAKQSQRPSAASPSTNNEGDTGPQHAAAVAGKGKVERVEKRLQEQMQLENELRRVISTSEARLQEHIEALSQLQLRYEDRDSEIRTARTERDAAVAAKALIERRREVQAEEISKLKVSKAQVETELGDARAALSGSTVPGVAELEQARSEARQAMAEKTRLEHRLATMTRDFEFTRTQYQSASGAAAEAANELSDLREENATLQRKASGEAAKLKAMNAGLSSEEHVRRIGQLELLLEDREDQLRRKDEELKVQLRGRGLVTRASSVPRSPKSYSRASSPVPVGLGRPQHPLRNS
ncbi:MAG: hypothetical protein M1837_001471 [Sclerophora amabilis]|nr:MAG: hypothetical protein M1837_001471 [Sclerophora amabilis]